jgi:hypothetical protein
VRGGSSGTSVGTWSGRQRRGRRRVNTRAGGDGSGSRVRVC